MTSHTSRKLYVIILFTFIQQALILPLGQIRTVTCNSAKHFAKSESQLCVCLFFSTCDVFQCL